MIVYDGLYNELKKKGIRKTDFSAGVGISSRTIAKIAKGEKLSLRTLKRIAEYLECKPDLLYKEVSPNPILQIIHDEKNGKISGGLYNDLQLQPHRGK